MDLFDIHQPLFTILGYNMSFVELLAVLTGLVAVYLASSGKIINFYIGLVNNVLYFLFFYQCHLYSMMLLQAIYFGISCYGIYSWRKGDDSHPTLKISTLNWSVRSWLTLVVIVVGILWGRAVIYLSGLYPENIEQPAYPYLDAVLTMASVVGQVLLTRKKLDNWMLWIVVDMISVVLYGVMGYYFTMLLYMVYLIIAVHAYIQWNKEMKQENSCQPTLQEKIK